MHTKSTEKNNHAIVGYAEYVCDVNYFSHFNESAQGVRSA